MTEQPRHFNTELTVIGSGIAGFAASIFALNHGLKVTQIGNTGAIAYTTGYLDLLGFLEGSRKEIEDPWQGLFELKQQNPSHPLSGIEREEIHTSINEFTAFITDCGIDYTPPGKKNITALTPAGTLKKTLCIPATMLAGTTSLGSSTPAVIIDFIGLKGFSAQQFVANLKDKWSTLEAKRIEFPDLSGGEIYPEVMARALEVPATREKLAVLLKEAAENVDMVGLPAILGMHGPDRVHQDLERLTGLTIFEIPTMPPSVPGIRLREMFEQHLPKRGATLIPQQKVQSLSFADNTAHLSLTDSYGPINITSNAVILATGRFLSGGLNAQVDGIHETLLNLPVTQPSTRSDWYTDNYTDPKGHPIHKAGIDVDTKLRPLRQKEKIYNKALFAAGIILAGQDWIRDRSGAGIAIATAYKAAEFAKEYIQGQVRRLNI